MAREDLYKLLGVERGATKDEIKKAYRKLARELHPDRNTGNKEAEEEFKKVSAAYAVLGDEEKRRMYDQYGIDGLRDGFDPNMWKQYGHGPRGASAGRQGGFEGVDFGGFEGFGAMEDIFEALFGQKRSARGRARATGESQWRRVAKEKGPNVKSTLEVELMDVVLGRELQVVVPIEGERRNLKVRVPKGIEDGKTMRLKGQGARSATGGPNGDLLLEIRIKRDGEYERKGNDLYKRERISVGEAYFGGHRDVETPYGRVKLSIPRGTQGGSKMRLKAKGIEKGEDKGDLYIEILIGIPTARDKKTETAVRELEDCY